MACEQSTYAEFGREIGLVVSTPSAILFAWSMIDKLSPGLLIFAAITTVIGGAAVGYSIGAAVGYSIGAAFEKHSLFSVNARESESKKDEQNSAYHCVGTKNTPNV